jgi:hypothetical protein
MLHDRACPQGGWNAGNGIVFGSALQPHFDSTAVALLALGESREPSTIRARHWIRRAIAGCPSAYSLAWSSLALMAHHDPVGVDCLARLISNVRSRGPAPAIEALSLAAIALKAFQENENPFAQGEAR